MQTKIEEMTSQLHQKDKDITAANEEANMLEAKLTTVKQYFEKGEQEQELLRKQVDIKKEIEAQRMEIDAQRQHLEN